ncbi:MAG: cyclic pyranopterin monophosphate synthase MoaC [Kiritimatiellae bacterium]|nr:cyclic pyranopterin monophosphate synthase MoaC [Kiritimatiellia bacterium]
MRGTFNFDCAVKRSLSHINQRNQPGMVDIAEKPITHRTATASATLVLPPEVRAALRGNEIHAPKGPVFQTAIIAGTQAVKRTSDLIPLCHPLPIEKCRIEIALDSRGRAVVTCEVSVHHKTGVEMEALTGASVAALTVYDMCKALSHKMVIRDIKLLSKTGGRRNVGRNRTT